MDSIKSNRITSNNAIMRRTSCQKQTKWDCKQKCEVNESKRNFTLINWLVKNKYTHRPNGRKGSAKQGHRFSYNVQSIRIHQLDKIILPQYNFLRISSDE